MSPTQCIKEIVIYTSQLWGSELQLLSRTSTVARCLTLFSVLVENADYAGEINQDIWLFYALWKKLTMKPRKEISLMQLPHSFMVHKGGQTLALEPHPAHKIFTFIFLAGIGTSGLSNSAVGGREAAVTNTI